MQKNPPVEVSGYRLADRVFSYGKAYHPELRWTSGSLPLKNVIDTALDHDYDYMQVSCVTPPEYS